MNIRTIIICLAAAISASAMAQQPGDGSKWRAEMLEAKHQLIIEQVGLTPTQQEQFMPMYEAMEKEIFQNNFEARVAAQAVSKRGNNATDTECFNAAKTISDAKVKEGEIESRYFDKFSQVLSKRQMFLLKQAEINFTRTMLRGRKQQQ